MTTKKQQKLLIQQENAYYKIKNKNGPITYSDCLLAIEYNERILPFIPVELLTEELCFNALKKNYSGENLIKYIPKTILSKKFASSIMDLNGMYLKYLPSNIVNKTIILKAVQQTIRAIKYIPEKFKTDDVYKSLIDIMPKTLKHINNPSLSLCEYAIAKSPIAFSYIKDTSILSTEMYEKVVALDWRNLKSIPTELVTQRLCEIAFQKSWKAFKYFPDKFKTTELCTIVIDKNVALIEYCPSSMLSVELCEKCLKKCGVLLEFIPDTLKTENLCLLAIEQDYKAVQYIPPKLSLIEFYIKCLKLHWGIINFIPDELKTFETYKALLNQISFSKEFTNWLMSDELFYPSLNSYENYEYAKYCDLKRFTFKLQESSIDDAVLLLERKLCLRTILNSSYDNETKVFTVYERHFKKLKTREFLNFNEYYLYLDGNLQEANLTEYDFKGIDISIYNLTGAYLSSQLLIQQGKYDGDFYNSSIAKFKQEASFLPALSNETIEAGLITHAETYSEKLNSYDRKIFYITDIHLNHRLIERFPKFATYDEIRFFIQKYVDKMIQTASKTNYNDYLLIGGDISFCFDISKIFYIELCRHWIPANIVVILGNHELWDFNRFGKKVSDNSLKNIITKYNELFSELGISFLQNSLLIAKNNEVSILRKNVILDKSAEELRSMALDSNLMIFGGIGFSAYNPEFNATNGIYRNVITSIEQDLYYTQRSETVYNKLCEVFAKDKLIILSHMPAKDWSRNKPISNWIYVSGHTHSNYCIQSDECTVYADNQIGYKAKTIGLKYFKTSIQYDIFKYYLDGIYKITKKQYINFNIGVRIYCTFNRNVNYITMLKRKGLYLFLLEDKENNKLYLLNGGVVNKLKVIDIDYYYENMLKYADYIKLGMEKYNEALKSIAKVIKKIGGEGTIHGCIVDIDFFNHIYLNPQDGSILAYYSPWFGNRYEYSSVEKLLDKQLPQLYANYRNLIDSSKSLMAIQNIDISSDNVTHIMDTTPYQPSRIIKRLQYITENSVIRIWSDDFVLNSEQYVEKNKKLIT